MKKNRISARLRGWDYRTAGDCFITICTSDRVHFFGECTNGKMQLSAAGAIAKGLWYDIPAHFPNVRLGTFVVMPNHIHGIVTITETISLPNTPTIPQNAFSRISPRSGSVSVIMRSYKGACTRFIRLIDPNFAWQSRFHDKIIRNPLAYYNIARYIRRNPLNWKRDKFRGGDVSL